MQWPMTGSWRVRVHAVRPFTIHGDLYYEVHVTRLDADPDRVFGLRLPEHAVAAPPAAGQAMELSFLMGQVTAGRVVGDAPDGGK